ncbi:YbaB/EbfC family nucleoid-associated protein [Nocardia vinacea]|uniref:YbaB/EbfC family nucleoid-associated protein n=1 Tax=Nocardia vinacea TaxID=96468 RepID=UPI002E0F2615|nr:YbaB/EbfC family nucleoid-associated protein [Nocardia vinacea]
MTTDIQEWERQLQRELTEIRSNSQQLAAAIAVVRGRSEARGVLVEVDADGDLTDLQIAPGAMHSPGSQLAAVLRDCHRKARADAKAKVKHLVNKADPRIRDQLERLGGEQKTPDEQREPKSEDEIQAADDAYFERMNQQGWRT